MKTSIHNCLNQMYKLVVDEPLKAAKDRAVLARIVLDEGSGCWSVEDIRLSPRGRASPYFKVGAEHYCARMDAITEQEASVMRRLQETGKWH